MWTRDLYSDLVTVDADLACPQTHPEEFIFETWLGTAAGCDCINLRPADYPANYYYGKCPMTEGEKPVRWKAYRDCTYVQKRPPVVQNRVNGVKYCSKVAPGFVNYEQPIIMPDGTYQCDSTIKDLVPCDESALTDPSRVDNALCVIDLSECPITSISLQAPEDLSSMVAAPHLSLAEDGLTTFETGDVKIYFSKSADSMPV